MAHYAKVTDGVVTQVIVAEPEFFDTFVDTTPGEWLKTSYNMLGGVYRDPETNEAAEDQSVIAGDEGRERKNYAGIGFSYDATRNAFISVQPYNSWVLNETSCIWEAPVAYPDDGEMYTWSEDDYQADNTTGWVQVNEGAA